MTFIRRTLQLDEDYHKKIKILSIISDTDIYDLFNEAIELYLDTIVPEDPEFIEVINLNVINNTITSKFIKDDYIKLSLVAVKLNLKKYQVLNILVLKILKFYNVNIN